MEGPSLFLAAEQLKPLIGKQIKKVSGNTKRDKERLLKKTIFSIFSYGKYLFFQFDTFALKVHFLLWGSFEATIKGVKVTGDYPKKERAPRLSIQTEKDHVEMYDCSVAFVEAANTQELCDFTIDIMSSRWDGEKAFRKVMQQPESEIADVLLDQTIFMGVGNIIKNEVLLLAGISPLERVRNLSLEELQKIIDLTRRYVFQFYEWRKQFELRKHYRVYRQSVCKQCGSKVTRGKTGKRNRVSYVCPHCQKEPFFLK